MGRAEEVDLLHNYVVHIHFTVFNSLCLFSYLGLLYLK